MVTVGYGDIYPVTEIEKIVSIGLMYVSCGVFGYIMNKIGNILSQFG